MMMAEGGEVRLAEDVSHARKSLDLPAEQSDRSTRPTDTATVSAPPVSGSIADAIMKARSKKPAFAEGGDVELPEDQMDRLMHMTDENDEDAREDVGDDMPTTQPARKPRPAYAAGGLVESILADRGHSDAPEEDPEMEDDFQPKVDLSQYHSTPDPEHDDVPAEDEDSLVGQIMRARRARRA